MVEEALVVWELQSCVPGDYYDRGALYDDFESLVIDMRKELAEGRCCMVERQLMTRIEWDTLPEGEGLFERKLCGRSPSR